MTLFHRSSESDRDYVRGDGLSVRRPWPQCGPMGCKIRRVPKDLCHPLSRVEVVARDFVFEACLGFLGFVIELVLLRILIFD